MNPDRGAIARSIEHKFLDVVLPLVNMDGAKALEVVDSLLALLPAPVVAGEWRGNDDATMRAFGASDAACVLYPDDTELDRACRAAYIKGASASPKQQNGEDEQDPSEEDCRKINEAVGPSNPEDLITISGPAWPDTSNKSEREDALEEAAKLVKSFWIRAEYEHIGDADVLESVCTQASEAIRALASTPPKPAAEDVVEQAARVLAKTDGHDPNELAPTLIMCSADNEAVPYWRVYEEQAIALAAANLLRTDKEPSSK